jgi:hypothetical protein
VAEGVPLACGGRHKYKFNGNGREPIELLPVGPCMHRIANVSSFRSFPFCPRHSRKLGRRNLHARS